MKKNNQNIIHRNGYEKKPSQKEIQYGIEIKEEVDRVIENIIQEKEALIKEISRKIQMLSKKN